MRKQCFTHTYGQPGEALLRLPLDRLWFIIWRHYVPLHHVQKVSIFLIKRRMQFTTILNLKMKRSNPHMYVYVISFASIHGQRLALVYDRI